MKIGIFFVSGVLLISQAVMAAQLDSLNAQVDGLDVTYDGLQMEVNPDIRLAEQGITNVPIYYANGAPPPVFRSGPSPITNFMSGDPIDQCTQTQDRALKKFLQMPATQSAFHDLKIKKVKMYLSAISDVGWSSDYDDEYDGHPPVSFQTTDGSYQINFLTLNGNCKSLVERLTEQQSSCSS